LLRLKNPDILSPAMKKDIHPQLYKDAVVTCVCGNTFTTVSTQKNINVEICSACHPFYTGQQKFVDTEGRIEKFAKKAKIAETRKAEAADLKTKNANKVVKGKRQEEPRKTLRDLLKEAKTE
jgi:large subunit ribosomal protein L31